MSTPQERIAARKAAVANEIGFKRVEKKTSSAATLSDFKDAMKKVASKPDIKLTEDFLQKNTTDSGELKISPVLEKTPKKPLDKFIERLKE